MANALHSAKSDDMVDFRTLLHAFFSAKYAPLTAENMNEYNNRLGAAFTALNDWRGNVTTGYCWTAEVGINNNLITLRLRSIFDKDRIVHTYLYKTRINAASTAQVLVAEYEAIEQTVRAMVADYITQQEKNIERLKEFAG